MAPIRSDFLSVLTERGFIHQCSDIEGLDAAARAGTITAYVGYDCTAPSLHVGSLISIMMLSWLQETGHRPIALMGGGTTRVGDPSGRDETRKILTVEQIEDNKDGIKRVFEQLPALRRAADAVMVDNAEWLTKLNYIDFLRDVGRHFSVNRMLSFDSREAAARPRAGAVLPRIQLHDPAGLRFRRAVPPLRLHAADGRLGPMGQHHQRHRSRPPHGHAAALRPDLPAAHHVVGRQDGQDRRRRRLAQRGHAVALRLLAVLAQHRGCRRRALPEALHLPAAGRESPGWRRSAAPRSTRPRSVSPPRRRRSSMASTRRGRPRRRRARPSRRARSPKPCRRSTLPACRRASGS